MGEVMQFGRKAEQPVFSNSNRVLTPCRTQKGSVSVVKDGTYRGGWRIRVGSKPDSAAEENQKRADTPRHE